MTKEQIEAIFDRVRTWPTDKQQEAAEMLLALEGDTGEVYQLSDEERADIEAGLEEARQGKFASDEEMRALFDKYRMR